MKRIVTSLLALFTLLATGCVEMREEQQLARLRSSVICVSYQFTSDKAVKIAVDRYNNSRINEKTLHGLIGLLWLAKNKPQFACMEADIFSELNRGKADNLPMAIRTVAFHKLKWPTLSAEEHLKLKSNLSEEDEDSPVNNSQDYKMALLGQILVGLNLQDDLIATESAEALDAMSNADNMKPLVDIAIKARDGNIEPAKKMLSQLRSRPGLSEQKKVMLENFQTVLSQQKPGKMSEEDVERMTNTLANTVITDVFKGSKLGAIIDRL